jgi:hypothetical protein
MGKHKDQQSVATEEVELPDTEDLIGAAGSQSIAKAGELPKTPTATATGDGRIAVLKHSLSSRYVERDTEFGRFPTPAGVELAIRNVSGLTIATAVFEAVFYDGEGNTLDTVRHRELDLKPDTSRALHIIPSISQDADVESYDVRIVRTSTADVERVQLRRHVMNTTETGEEEIRGTVRNLSHIRTDAAVVATFFGPKKEPIGTRVLLLRDIEPDTVKQFVLKFKPQPEDEVRDYAIAVGEIQD